MNIIYLFFFSFFCWSKVDKKRNIDSLKKRRKEDVDRVTFFRRKEVLFRRAREEKGALNNCYNQFSFGYGL